MLKIAFALAILSSIFSAAGARAEKTALIAFVIPAAKGYVLTVDLPETGTAEKWRRSIIPNRWGYEIQFQSRSSYFVLYFRASGKERTFESAVNQRKAYLAKVMARYWRFYESGINNALGPKTYFYLHSPKTISVGGKKIKATKPTTKTYYSQFHNRVNIELRIHVGSKQVPPYALTESLPLFERIARSIKVTPASAMAPGQMSRYFASPDTRLSQSGGYYLDAALKAMLSPGWAGRVLTAEPASGSAALGRVVVEVTPSRKLPPGRYEKLTLVLQGIPLAKASSLAGFLDTGKAHLASALANAKKIETPKAVVMPGASRFCYLHRKVKGGVSTGKVYVATYAGKDRDGQDRKVRIFTAGGFTMACNIIYAADPKTFDASRERIGAILNSLRIEIESPARTELVTVVSPVVKGYVLSVDVPKTGTAEKWRRSIDPSERGLTIFFSSRSSSSILYFRVYKKPGNFERLINYRKGLFKRHGLKIYETGFNNALGRKTFFFLSSNKTISVGGKKIKATKPTTKTYITLFDNRVTVEMRIDVGPRQVPPLALSKSLPLFERIAKSIKVTHASAMAPGQLSRYFSSPNTRLSKRHRYYLNATVTATLPPGWSASVLDARHAIGTSGQGRVVVELTPSRKSPPGRYQKLTIVLQGIPILKAFSLAGFLDTAKAHLASALPNAKKIDTPGAVAKPGGSDFCYSNRRVKRGVSTGKVYVATYAGKDGDGQDRKVRIFTAGGFTMACNVIYAADPKTFDASKARIGAILKSLKVSVETPILGVR